MGVNLLKALGIDNSKFCNVFNNYGSAVALKENKIDASRTVDRQQLKALISTAIGSNYYMVHGKENGSVDFWFMDPAKNDAMATIVGNIELIYVGNDGRAKRIDMKFGNSYFDFKLNIRNKQSGVYPSHLMMDYKSKSGLNKTTIR